MSARPIRLPHLDPAVVRAGLAGRQPRIWIHRDVLKEAARTAAMVAWVCLLAWFVLDTVWPR